MKAHLLTRVLVLITIPLCSPGGSAASDVTRPNVLLAIADDMSWPHTSIAGCKAIHTPNIDRVARSGVVFRHGFCGAPGCSPSRAALLIGRHVWMNEEASTHHGLFPSKFVSFPDLLSRSGYTTGFTGKPWSPGHSAEGRQGNPAGPAWNNHKLAPPLSGIKDTDYTANFAGFLAQRKPGAPFCFWFGCNEPHRGYERGSGLKSGKKLDEVQVPGFLPDTPDVRSDFLDYFTEIEWFDQQLGQMLDLTRYNDVGYPVRALRTPQYLYLRNLRPDRWPIGDPQRINKQTGELMPRHAGCYRDIDEREPLDWLIKHAPSSSKCAAMVELITGRHPAEELFDIQADPDCLHNLATSRTHADVMARLAAQMDAELKRTRDPRLYGGNPDIADTYPNVNPKNKMGEGNYPAPTPSK